MRFNKTSLLLTTAIIFFAACQKNSDTTSVVFETTSNDQAWVPSGVMADGRDLDNVVIDVPELATIEYSYLSVEERYAGTDWEEISLMGLTIAINSHSDRNIYTVDASRGRTIRVYNFRRRAGTVSIRVRAHRRR